MHLVNDSGPEGPNWIDPDVLAYNDGSQASYSKDLESKFHNFFKIGWLDPRYDDLRIQWDPVINDEDPYGRLYGKIALWSLVRFIFKDDVM